MSTGISIQKKEINSIQFPLSLDACLREAASAKAGERAGPAPRRVQDNALNLTWFRG